MREFRNVTKAEFDTFVAQYVSPGPSSIHLKQALHEASVYGMGAISDDSLRVILEAAKAYTHRLIKDISLIGEPPLLTLNDFSLGNWPESVVAKVVLCSRGYPNDDGTLREDEYMIRKDL